MRIYTDENVDIAIPAGLRLRGVDVWSAKDAGNLSLSDENQLQYAVRENAVLFTHDKDLVIIANEWIQRQREFWGVFYVHQEKLTIGECIRRLKFYAEILEDEEMKNRVEFL